MKVYMVIYDYGLGSDVKAVFTNKEKAEYIVKNANGYGVRHGTYSVIEKELIE